MFYQDFGANQYQHQSSPQLHAQVEAFAAEDAYQGACYRKRKGGESDDGYGREDGNEGIHAYACEGYAHGQRVNTGGYGQCDNHLQPGGVETVFVFVVEAFFYHASAQACQQAECNPMVVILNQVAESAGGKPADEWHGGLEKPEKESHDEKSAPADAAHDDAARDGDCEAVHGEAEG